MIEIEVKFGSFIDKGQKTTDCKQNIAKKYPDALTSGQEEKYIAGILLGQAFCFLWASIFIILLL